MSKYNYPENISEKHSTDDNLNFMFDLQFSNEHRFSLLLDEITFINNRFQVLTSFILCCVGLIAALFYIGIFLQRCFGHKSFSHQIFIQSLFDLCHLINILFPHFIMIIVYRQTSTNREYHCPLSMFCFSLASVASISFLCLGAFHRYMYSMKKQIHYRDIRHRSLAHRLILITSISWLIFNFPKIDLKENISI